MRNDRYTPAMRVSIGTWIGTILLGAVAHGQTIVVTRSAGRQVREAPPANFTGVARVDTLFGSLVSADVSGGSVAFEAGAHGVARAPGRPDPDCDGRRWPRAALG